MPSTKKPSVIILMGVSGSGKSTVGALLAGRLNWAFDEGDSLHPKENVEKMRAGIPLNDEDRRPWLLAIAAQIDAWLTSGVSGVITCSALKRDYRELLVGHKTGVGIVYLKGSKDVIAHRLTARQGHFMPAALLDSQLSTLQEPHPDENVVTVEIGDRPEVVADRIIKALDLEPRRV